MIVLMPSAIAFLLGLLGLLALYALSRGAARGRARRRSLRLSPYRSIWLEVPSEPPPDPFFRATLAFLGLAFAVALIAGRGRPRYRSAPVETLSPTAPLIRDKPDACASP